MNLNPTGCAMNPSRRIRAAKKILAVAAIAPSMLVSGCTGLLIKDNSELIDQSQLPTVRRAVPVLLHDQCGPRGLIKAALEGSGYFDVRSSGKFPKIGCRSRTVQHQNTSGFSGAMWVLTLGLVPLVEPAETTVDLFLEGGQEKASVASSTKVTSVTGWLPLVMMQTGWTLDYSAFSKVASAPTYKYRPTTLVNSDPVAAAVYAKMTTNLIKTLAEDGFFDE